MNHQQPKVLEMYENRAVRQPEIFGKVTVRHINPPKEISVTPLGTTDLAMTFRNVHNWVMAEQEHDYFAAFFQALKPGGVLGIEEHRAPPDADMQSMRTSGYVTEAYVKQIAQAAGFVPTKAAQRILAESLARDLGPKGVHVAYLVIDAVIDVPWARKMHSEAADDFFIQPKSIAARSLPLGPST